MWRGFDWALLALAVALAAGARLWRLDSSCLWFDELFGLHAARLAWGELLRFVALDLIHPPLFYLLLKIWTAVGGDSARWLRLLPVACAVAALLPLSLLARELRLPARTLRLALLLFAASGYLIKYAQEVRMYAPLLALAAASLWLFARLCRSSGETARRRDGDGLRSDSPQGIAGGAARRTGDASRRSSEATRRRGRAARLQGRGAWPCVASLALVNLLLVYTHYFGWLLVALELAFAVVRARTRARAFALSAAVAVVCFAPWAWAVARAAGVGGGADDGGIAQNIGWAARPGPLELFEPYLTLHEPFRFRRHTHEPSVLAPSVVLSALLFGPALLALGWRTRGGKSNKDDGEGKPDEDDEDGNADEDDTGEKSAVDDKSGKSDRDVEGGKSAVDDKAGKSDEDDEDDRSVVDNGDDKSVVDNEDDKSVVDSMGAGGRFAVGFLAFFSFAPVVVAFALSWLLPHSIWGARHLVVIAPAYLLLAAHALASLRPRWLSDAACALLGCWLLVAAAGYVVRRPAPHVWCAWEPLAREALRAEFANGGALGAARGEIKMYALEDLAAYHLWHALEAAGEGRVRVVRVRDFPGAVEDRAFFLPRGFDGVSVVGVRDAFREEQFWIAFRDAAGRGEPAPLKFLSERGYEIERRFELEATGQTVFMLRAKRIKGGP